jgi:hypothetical protein
LSPYASGRRVAPQAADAGSIPAGDTKFSRHVLLTEGNRIFNPTTRVQLPHVLPSFAPASFSGRTRVFEARYACSIHAAGTRCAFRLVVGHPAFNRTQVSSTLTGRTMFESKFGPVAKSGLLRLTLNQTITGSNPVGSTKLSRPEVLRAACGSPKPVDWVRVPAPSRRSPPLDSRRRGQILFEQVCWGLGQR